MHRNFFRQKQRGVVLLVALIVLVAMTLAGIALVRSVDTGNLAAGNLAFRQGAALAADEGIEAGIAWLDGKQGAGGGLTADQSSTGYYATSQDALDVTNKGNTSTAVDWDHNDCSDLTGVTNCVKPSAAAEVKEGDTVLYTYSYIIHRLCSKPLGYNDPDNSCVTYQSADDKSAGRDAPQSGDTRFAGEPVPYYRITARVLGPRNTTSFVQAVVHY
jgi:type IV pilus assembly protein PilX